MQKSWLRNEISSASFSFWWPWHLILSHVVLLYFSRSLCLLWNFLWVKFSLTRPVFSLFSFITLMWFLLLLLVLLSLLHPGPARNFVKTVIRGDILCLTVLPSNGSNVTRLVSLFTTTQPSLLSLVNHLFFQGLLITLLLLLLKRHPLILLSPLFRLVS